MSPGKCLRASTEYNGTTPVAQVRAVRGDTRSRVGQCMDMCLSWPHALPPLTRHISYGVIRGVLLRTAHSYGPCLLRITSRQQAKGGHMSQRACGRVSIHPGPGVGHGPPTVARGQLYVSAHCCNCPDSSGTDLPACLPSFRPFRVRCALTGLRPWRGNGQRQHGAGPRRPRRARSGSGSLAHCVCRDMVPVGHQCQRQQSCMRTHTDA